MNQEIYSGYGACNNLSTILKKTSPRKIFLVNDKDSYSLSGAKKLLGDILKDFEITSFSDFEPNPKLEDVKKAINTYNSSGCDFVIGVGGGSVIDIAKTVSLFALQQDKLDKFINGEASILPRKIPSLMIPTTAGTGSESTHFSVIYVGKEKHSIPHKSMLPDCVILDPSLTLSLPPYITASTGMDALCQGVEAFWSVNSTKSSRQFGKEAIKIALANIITAVTNPDKKARENMLLASNLAGRAINISQTTAAHSVSYPITSYFGIPHGHAVALTLPYFIEFNGNISSDNLQDRRGVKFVKDVMSELLEILEVNAPDEAKQKIINIMIEINLETRLSKLGIRKSDIEIIIKKGFNPQRVKNNPKIVTEKDLRALLEKII